MMTNLKRFLYFPVASYFRFFASIRLKRWSPKVIVVTGSNGKTTLLHMLESQIGDQAKYSHHANSSFGIPFDILGLQRKSLIKSEWLGLILKAPFAAFRNPSKEKLYVVEADCDRPGEGRFLSELLRPEIVLWISTSKTHSMNFDILVQWGKFATVEEAIAYEFGYFIEYSQDTVIVNGDMELMSDQLKRTKAKIISIKKADALKKYKVDKSGTIFEIEHSRYRFNCLLPKEVFYSIEMCRKAVEYLNLSFDNSFSKLSMPPGRGSIFQGVKDITIVDSSYNLSPGSLRAVLDSFNKFFTKDKWVVIGDMLELGESEKEEHEKLAKIISGYDFNKIILMGPRVSKYSFPKLENLLNDENKLVKFAGPKETLDYIIDNIKGGETILFKGARFMEGIIEHLLKNKEDINKLTRREKIWDIRRKKFGL